MKYLSDFLLLVGAGAISYGAWRLDPTAGIITAGSLLLLAGIARGRAEAVVIRGGGK
jgi:hypothetical protein